MWIKGLRIHNVRGFIATDWLEFSSGFNVVVGANNSGKSTLLECFKLQQCALGPYKGLKTNPDTLVPKRIRVRVVLTAGEVVGFLERQASILIPVRNSHTVQSELALIQQQETLEIEFETSSQHGFVPLHSPSHGLFSESYNMICPLSCLS